MRLRARVDANQAMIVRALRMACATVEPKLARVGGGVPDLLVGFRGRNYLMEVKDGAKPARQRALTDAEAMWHIGWGGQVAVVSTVAEALAVIGVTESDLAPTTPDGSR